MFRFILFILSVFFSIALHGQSKTIVIYKSTGSMDLEYLVREAQNAAKERGGDSVDFKLPDSAKMNADMKELNELMLKAFADTITAWKEGNFIKSTSVKEGTKQRLYELPAKRFLVVQKGTRGNPDRYDTTYSDLFNCEGDTSCNVKLIPEPEKGKKLILGFTCINYTIRYKDGTEMYSIWVTDAIKPALPVHAMVESPKKILEGFTALEIKDFVGDGSNTHTLKTAIKILH